MKYKQRQQYKKITDPTIFFLNPAEDAQGSIILYNNSKSWPLSKAANSGHCCKLIAGIKPNRSIPFSRERHEKLKFPKQRLLKPLT